jgi:7-cyano-7-deazaguanine reductase
MRSAGDALRLLGDNTAEFRGLESFDSPSGLASVAMTSDEVTAVCPVTGQPDWYAVAIRYAPAGRCVESKSLKLYLRSFRDRGLFCEAFAARVLADVVAAVAPASCVVTVTQKPRGGVSIVAEARAPEVA